MSLKDLSKFPRGYQAWSTLEWPQCMFPGYRGDWYPIVDTESQFYKTGNPAVRGVTYRCNAHGFRTGDLNELAGFPGRKLLTLGCSFTFALGVPQDTSWPELLGQHLGLRVANLGGAAASPDMMARVAHQAARRLQPTLTVALFPDMTRSELLQADHVKRDVPPDCVTRLRLGGFWFNPDNEPLIRSFELSKARRAALEEVMDDEVECFFNFVRAWTLTRAAVPGPLLWSTWDKKILDLPDEVLTPYVDVTSFVRPATDFWNYHLPVETKARDGLHPGLAQHAEFAETLRRAYER